MTSERSFHYAACVGGLSDPSTRQYKGRRAVFDVINTLQSSGLQRGFDIPQIAVVGSQSVGKSSLIESIAGIKLPRAAGTCTRCPIECHLRRSTSPWSCNIDLRMEHKPNERFGLTLTDKSEFEERIRRAQLAILNPSRKASDFLGTLGLAGSEMPNELSFSADVISVSISGHDDDLSFVDLPGVIVSAEEDGDDADVEKVKNLVLDVIKKPSCLILLVVSAETETQNQVSRHLAKQADPSGNRTIRVLTKPDRIPVGEHDSWVRILSNGQKNSQYGWYCVKQSDQQQLSDGISWEEARENEVNFFANTEPWRNLPKDLKSRVGTDSLTRTLGGELFHLICKRLPGLLNEVMVRVQVVKLEIDRLPITPTDDRDSLATLMNLIEGFKQDVQNLVKGRPEDGYDGLVQTFRESRGRFREAISRQAPEFQVFDRPKQQNLNVPGQSNRRTFLRPSIHIPAPEQESISTLQNTDDMHGKHSESIYVMDSERVVYMDEVLQYAERAITRELPHNPPYAVKEYFISRFTKDWSAPATELFECIDQRFSKELKRLVNQHFSPFSPGELDKAVMRSVLAQLKHCRTRAIERIEESIILEKEEPTTSNEDTLDDYKRHYRAMYMEARQLLNKAPNPPEEHSMAEVLRLLKQMNKEHLLQPIPVEETNNAIEIMAEVRAYYELAFRRFVDNIPRIIDFELLKGFSRTIGVGSRLFQDVVHGNDDIHERCTAFLKEDPEILLSRKLLKEELDILAAALESLEAISAVNLGPGSESDEVFAARLDDFPVHSSGTPLSRPRSPFSQSYSPFGRPTSPPAPSRPASPLLAQGDPVFLYGDPIQEYPPYPGPPVSYLGPEHHSSYLGPFDTPSPSSPGPSPLNVSLVMPKKKKGKKPVRDTVLG